MALGLIGLLDLSIVTDRLIALLVDARDNSPLWGGGPPSFNIEITGAAPDTARDGADCILSLYLIHAATSKHTLNSPIPQHNQPPGPQSVRPAPFHPLGLELFYILTAWADKKYVQEQKAMSIALKCFHDHPIVRTTVTIDGTPVPEEFTLTMELQTPDDLSRLWQAVTVPARLAAVYRVSVVFLTPEAPAALNVKPKTVGLTVIGGDLGAGSLPSLLGTQRSVTFRSPITTGIPQPDLRTFDLSPAVAAPGESLTLFGSALASPQAQQVFLLDGGTEHDITAAWHPNAANDTASRIVLTLPATVGALPANAPPAGVYQLRVGSGTFRSNATPFSVAARVTPPGGEPFLQPAGSDFTIAGAGFVPNATQLLVGGTALAEVPGAPAAGQFSISGGTSLTFRLPAAFPGGVHDVRVRVNGVESAPAWWVKLP